MSENINPRGPDRWRKVVVVASAYLLAGAVVSAIVAWGLAFKDDSRARTATVEAVRSEERLSLTVRRGLGTVAVRLVRAVGDDWSPIRAAGQPDTPRMGDLGTAWASATTGDSPEWLELAYGAAVLTRAIEIFETNAPGALTRVVAIEPDGTKIELWRGQDPATPNVDGIYVATLPVEPPRMLQRIRIELDSPSVPGWNEIDAVGLIGANGAPTWAIDVRASSTYAKVRQSSQSINVESLRRLAPGWVDVRFKGAVGVMPVAELRTFVARGFPLPALWGEVPNDYGFDPLALRHPIWPGLLLDAMVYGALLYGVYLIAFRARAFIRESLRLRRGCCMLCGYDLRYDLAAGCPECGWRRDDASRRESARIASGD